MQETTKKGLRKAVDKDGIVIALIASKDVPYMRTMGPPLLAVERAGYDVHKVTTSGDLGARIEFYKDGKLKHTAVGFQPQAELLSIIKSIEEQDKKEEGFEETESKPTEEEIK
jgi:hypothetical protein